MSAQASLVQAGVPYLRVLGSQLIMGGGGEGDSGHVLAGGGPGEGEVLSGGGGHVKPHYWLHGVLGSSP